MIDYAIPFCCAFGAISTMRICSVEKSMKIRNVEGGCRRKFVFVARIFVHLAIVRVLQARELTVQ